MCVCSLCCNGFFLFQTIDKSPQSSCEVAKIPQNRARNRFGNIFPCKLYITLNLFKFTIEAYHHR